MWCILMWICLRKLYNKERQAQQIISGITAQEMTKGLGITCLYSLHWSKASFLVMVHCCPSGMKRWLHRSQSAWFDRLKINASIEADLNRTSSWVIYVMEQERLWPMHFYFPIPKKEIRELTPFWPPPRRPPTAATWPCDLWHLHLLEKPQGTNLKWLVYSN